VRETNQWSKKLPQCREKREIAEVFDGEPTGKCGNEGVDMSCSTSSHYYIVNINQLKNYAAIIVKNEQRGVRFRVDKTIEK